MRMQNYVFSFREDNETITIHLNNDSDTDVTELQNKNIHLHYVLQFISNHLTWF